MRRPRHAPIAALLAALLLGACAPPGSPAARATATPSPGIAGFIPVAERFVERHRGLKFKAPVKVAYLDDTAFQARVTADNHADPEGTARDAKELAAARLVPLGTDLQKAEDALLGAGVIGFYDPKSKELVVRGTADTPATEHVLVHELTHALQDQWFGIGSLDVRDPTREDDAYRTLVEGDARRVENEFLATLTPAQRRQADTGGAAVPAGVPEVLAELLSFPYVVGPPFVAALLAAGGQKRLDAAFGDARPRYTAEVLDPPRYLAGFTASSPPPPAPAGARFDQGIFGEEDLLYVLERAPGRPQGTSLRDLARGWRGDAYVAYDTAAGPCLRVAMRFDTPAHAQQAAAALGTLRGYSVDSVAAADVTWTSCA